MTVINGPRQRTTDKRWDYTSSTGGLIRPIGYCQPWDEATASRVTDAHLQELVAAWLEEARPYKSRYHEAGHATPQAACDCYRRYLLDQKVKWRQHPHIQRKCLVQDCHAWTTGYAQIEEREMPLCDEHRHQDCLEAIFPKRTTEQHNDADDHADTATGTAIQGADGECAPEGCD